MPTHSVELALVLLGHVFSFSCLLLKLLVVFLVALSLQSDLLLLASSVSFVDFVDVVFVLLLLLGMASVQLCDLVEVILVGVRLLLLHMLDGLLELGDFADELILVGVVLLRINDDLL